jgi:hypothetical protein
LLLKIASLKIKIFALKIMSSISELNYEITPLPINSSSMYQAANCPSAMAD